MNDGRTECTFLWRIENYSYCWHENRIKLLSPEFSADGFEGTVWAVKLCPRGNREEDIGYISLFLRRCEDDDGPEEFFVEYEISILVENGLPESISYEVPLKKGMSYGGRKFLTRDEVLLHRKADFLPQDTLTVRCKMWKGEGNAKVVKEITARTRIEIEEIAFLHLIKHFRKLQANEKNEIEIESHSKNRSVVISSLYFVEDPSEGIMMLEITPTEKNQILVERKIFLVDRYGKKIECGEADNRLDAVREDIQNLPLTLTRQEILNRRRDYLPEDNLSLKCECVFSTGVAYQKIEETVYGTSQTSNASALSKRI